MKVQLASDLHLEFLGRNFPEETVIRPARDADVLVLAGDIHVGTAAVELFRDWPVPVLYVVGNHEAYGLCLDDVREQFAIATKGIGRGRSLRPKGNCRAQSGCFAMRSRPLWRKITASAVSTSSQWSGLLATPWW